MSVWPVTPFAWLVMVALLATGGPSSLFAGAPQEAAAKTRVSVQVNGGTCRPSPTLTWFAADGRELVTTSVSSAGVTLPVVGSVPAPAYLLAECRGYYVAGWKQVRDVASHYRIVLDRAVPPRQAGHADGVRVSVRDGEGDGVLPGARVYWVYADGRESAAVVADASGLARLPVPSTSEPPRFLLVDASDQRYQITGQAYRLYFDEYTIVMRAASF